MFESESINGHTLLYGIIGDPVAHSLSPAMHNNGFAALGENRVYLPFPVQDVEQALAGLKGLNIKGVSVTIPHKQTVMQFLDSIDPIALKIGAVNTIKVEGEPGNLQLLGSNTDWLGANRALSRVIDLSGTTCVLLGAGGSARAIGFGLIEAGARVILCSRTKSSGKNLAADLDCPWVALDDVASISGNVLINATSVGMQPGADVSPVAATIPAAFQVVMDIVYAPLRTRLLRDADKCGCRCVNGLEMLLFQGVAQFELWTGLVAPVAVMRQTLQDIHKS